MDSVQPITLEAIWADDLLERRDDAEFLIRFLTNRAKERASQGRTGSYVLNIDAGWGSGKTFFLHRMKRALVLEGYLVASVNAWADDHADDPLLSVMSAIDIAVGPAAHKNVKVQRSLKTLKTTTQRVAIAAVKGAATQLVRRAIGDAADVIAAELGVASENQVVKGATTSAQGQAQTLIDSRAKSLLDSFNEAKRSIDSFKKQLDDLLKTALVDDSERRPMFVLVDELDRCRPPYAIALLERIKHLFEIDNVVFVVATDTRQLCHAIGAVYGAGFDSTRYLGRFFDRTYTFEAVSRADFVVQLLESVPLPATKISLPPDIMIEDYLVGAFDYFGLSPRDIEQVYDIFRSIVTAWDLKLKIEMAVLLPLVVGQQQKLPPALTAEFHRDLGRLAVANGGDLEAWKIRFTYGGLESVHGLTLLNDFFGYASKDLPNIGGDVTAGYSRWVQTRFREEFSILHNNTFNPRMPPLSIVRKYPEFIRSAGRLVPTKDA